MAFCEDGTVSTISSSLRPRVITHLRIALSSTMEGVGINLMDMAGKSDTQTVRDILTKSTRTQRLRQESCAAHTKMHAEMWSHAGGGQRCTSFGQ
jgi:hypothetical protein